MTKLLTPLLSFKAQGRLGDIAYVRRGGRNIAEHAPVVEDVRSAPQLSWRTMFEKCASLWHTLSDTEKASWESLARSKHMTGYALWQSQCLRPNPGIYLPLDGGTMSGAIAMNNYPITGLPDPSDPQDADTLAARQAAILPLAAKRIYTTLDMSLADHDQAYTGVGFQPTALHAFAFIEATVISSWGFADSALYSRCMHMLFSGVYGSLQAFLVRLFESAGNSQRANVVSYDADGFTLHWDKGGSPTATATIIFMCLR